VKLIIDVNPRLFRDGFERPFTEEEKNVIIKAIGNGTPLISVEQKIDYDIDGIIARLELLRRRVMDADSNLYSGGLL
jgi:hypothetical protein